MFSKRKVIRHSRGKFSMTSSAQMRFNQRTTKSVPLRLNWKLRLRAPCMFIIKSTTCFRIIGVMLNQEVLSNILVNTWMSKISVIANL